MKKIVVQIFINQLAWSPGKNLMWTIGDQTINHKIANDNHESPAPIAPNLMIKINSTGSWINEKINEPFMWRFRLPKALWR